MLSGALRLGAEMGLLSGGMGFMIGSACGLAAYVGVRVIAMGFYTVKPNERAVITSWGRAKRLPGSQGGAVDLSEDEKDRYQHPAVEVVKPGGPYLKMPWQTVHKVDVATRSVDLVWDPTKEQSTIEAVTKDNLTTGVNGQIRFKASEDNLYAYLFGVQSPLEHVMGFFISVLRERIANFTDPRGTGLAPVTAGGAAEEGSLVDLSDRVSINDLRKNLPLINEYMEAQCRATAGRYGIELDAALITGIDPP
ncbi:MAG: regulator of protease activity HflC (stomatin/prohibitin superfamily), partial [Myxococcota bacterium]